MGARERVPERWLGRIRAAERIIVFVGFAVMAGVVFADVVARELGSGGLPWARQTGVWSNIVVAMFGVGLASASGSHLRPRFADGWLPSSWEPALIRIGEAITAAFCFGFACLVILMTWESYQLQERSAILRVVVWPMQAVIAVAFVLAGIRHLCFTIWTDLRPKPTNAFAVGGGRT